MEKLRQKIKELKLHFTRKKILVPTEVTDQLEGTKLERCLTLFDLVSLGTASSMGQGLYIVSGFIAQQVAGPGVILSFLLGGIASLLSGLCYAEFGGRVPKTAGGAYVYSYITVGELISFVTGWNLILEYMIGTSSGGVALSALADTFSNKAITTYLTENTFPVVGRAYPDFLGFLICIVMAVVLASGVKNSINFNNILNCISFIVWLFMIVVGSFYARSAYWTEFGFLPYGANGVLKGAATCFYAFIGFDIIASTGEETLNPGKFIPIAVVLTLLINLTVFVSAGTIITMMVPYFELTKEAPVINVWRQREITGVQYVVMVGGFSALVVSLLGSAFPMPRIIYAMGSDGLIFKWLAKVNKHTKTPLNATFVSGLAAGLLALFISLDDLIEMMSIGTLLAYTMVSISILILRYRPHIEDELYIKEFSEMMKKENGDLVSAVSSPSNISDESTPFAKKVYAEHSYSDDELTEARNRLKYETRFICFKVSRSKIATKETAENMEKGLAALVGSIFLTDLLLVLAENPLFDLKLWAWMLVLVGTILIATSLLYILIQPWSRKELRFKTPGLPFIPAAAMFANIYLIMRLSPFTWIRFLVWMTIGFGIYFTYGIKHAPEIYEERLAILAKISTKESPASDITCLSTENDVKKDFILEQKDDDNIK